MVPTSFGHECRGQKNVIVCINVAWLWWHIYQWKNNLWLIQLNKLHGMTLAYFNLWLIEQVARYDFSIIEPLFSLMSVGIVDISCRFVSSLSKDDK